MKKITKEMCLILLKDYYKGKLILQIFISVFVVIFLGEVTENYLFAAVGALTLGTLCIKEFVKSKNKKVGYTDFYIEEDVVIKVKKSFYAFHSTITKSRTYTFKKYGKHKISKDFTVGIRIPLQKEKEISAVAFDRLSFESCERGDNFYLLIAEENGKPKIIQAFYKYYFELSNEDFELVDNKYCCKNDEF